MAYTKTVWVDNSSPYINATNLNHIEGGIKDNEDAINDVETSLNNKIGDVSQLSGTDVVDYLMNKTYSKILWENQTPTEDFENQTINLNESLSNYDCYEIIFRQSTVVDRNFSTGKIPVGKGTILNVCLSYPKYRPTSEFVTGSSITFEDGKSVNSIGSSTTDNTFLIPVYVIGYKTGLF